MKRITTAIFSVIALIALASTALALGNNSNGVKESIVKIDTVSSNPIYWTPWEIERPSSSGGSGCIIKGNRILTNAHVVSNTKYIQVMKYGDSVKYTAKVMFVSHEADLAVLTVEDNNFFNDTVPIELGNLPEAMDALDVYGFPIGGDSLSITRGIISRIELVEYVHSGWMYLGIQVDAAINPGNSGGPAIKDGKIIGIAMQGIEAKKADNIGYIIPTPIIRHFLDDISDGKYDGFVGMGFSTQSLENPDLRRSFKMSADISGVLVNRISWASSAKGFLKLYDILLKIDDYDIANDGTIELRPKERIRYEHVFDDHQIGEKIKLKVLRNGKIKTIKYALTPQKVRTGIVGTLKYDIRPEYYIYAGYVFTPITKNLICEWGNECSAPIQIKGAELEWTTEDTHDKVILLDVLADDINKGHHDWSITVVESVNGKPYRDFKEFYELISKSKMDYITIKLSDKDIIVINKKHADKVNQSILDNYEIKEGKHFN